MEYPDDLEPVLQKLIKHPYAPDAWEQVYCILWPWILSKVQAQLKTDISTAEDLSQEVLLRLLRMAPFGQKFGNAKMFRAYVKRICQNLVLDYMRKQMRERAHYVLSNQEFEPLADAHTDPMTVLIWAETRRHLEEEDSRLLDLWIAGFSPTEIADKLNLSVGTIYNRLSELRQKLRALASPPKKLNEKPSAYPFIGCTGE